MGQDPNSSKRDYASIQNSYDLRSGASFGTLSLNISLRGGDSEGGYQGGNETWSQNLTWPILDLSISGLERRGVLNRLFQNASLRTSFSTGREESGEFQNQVRSDPNHISRRWSLSPSLQTTWKNGITTNLSTDFSRNKDELPLSPSTREGKTQNYSLTLGYGLRAPGGLQIPLIGRVRFKSTLDLKLNIKYNTTLQKTFKVLNPEGDIKQNLATFSVSPSASYTFSQTLTGSLDMGFQEKNTTQLGHTNRDIWLNFSVTFRF